MNEDEPEEALPESDYNRIKEFLEDVESSKIFRDRYAILDESGNVIRATLMEWGVWFERNKQRYICFDAYNSDTYRVSTVFLGINHNFNPSPNAKPLWFETMVFGPEQEIELQWQSFKTRPNLWVCQCATLTKAKAMHLEGIAWLKNNYQVIHDEEAPPGLPQQSGDDTPRS